MIVQLKYKERFESYFGCDSDHRLMGICVDGIHKHFQVNSEYVIMKVESEKFAGAVRYVIGDNQISLDGVVEEVTEPCRWGIPMEGWMSIRNSPKMTPHVELPKTTELPVVHQGPSWKCSHLGEATGRKHLCQSCRGKVKVAEFLCHHKDMPEFATISKEIEGLGTCFTCPFNDSPLNRADMQQPNVIKVRPRRKS